MTAAPGAPRRNSRSSAAVDLLFGTVYFAELKR